MSTQQREPEWDSDEYDRLIRAERAEQRRNIKLPSTAPSRIGKQTMGTEGRGRASDEDLRRRAEADRAIRGLPKRAPARPAATPIEPQTERKPEHRSHKPPPDPRWQSTKGTWLMKFRHNGTHYRRSFDTEAQAMRWRDEIKEA